MRAERAGIAIVLWLACLPVQAGKKEAAQESLEQLQSRIAALKKELDSTQAAHSEAADALRQSERAISETNRKLFELQQQQRDNRSTLQALQQEKSSLERTIAQQQQRLSSQLYQQYLKGQRSALQIVLNGEHPAQIARDLQYYGYVARERARLIITLRKNLDRVAVLNDRTAATLRKIEELRTEQEKQRQTLQQEKAAHKALLGTLEARIKAQRSEIGKLRRDEKRLTALVQKLSRIVASQPRTRSKPATPAQASRDTPLVTEELPSPALDGSSFAALRGKLRLPVRGEITNRFGSPREDSGLSWKGLFIKAAEGQEVKSVGSGRVVFADWLRGFGNLLIIDHGGGYMSLYGYNQALLRKVGDEVKAGDDIAIVGNSGGNAEHGLYFELRHLSKPIDPLSWSAH